MPSIDPGSARALRHAGLVFLVAGALGWLFFYYIFRGTAGQDWMVFDTAAKAWRRGDMALLGDGRRFTDAVNASHAAWLSVRLAFHPFVYPPTALLMVLPFAWLPWMVSYMGFQVASLAGLVVSLRPWCEAGWRRVVFIAGVLLCPATAFTLWSGQNSFLTAAIVVGGIYLCPRRPLLAGAIFGLLAFKPQLGLMLPIALASMGAWRTIVAAAVSASVFAAASVVALGTAPWLMWMHLMLGGQREFATWALENRMRGQSVFACLHVLGVPNRVADFGQACAVAVAGVLVWKIFRGGRPAAEKLAGLLCGIILSAPHVSNYDAVMQGIAAMLVLMQGFARPFRRGEALLAMLVWAVTAVSPPYVFYISVVTPVLLAGLMVRLACGPTPLQSPDQTRPPAA